MWVFITVASFKTNGVGIIFSERGLNTNINIETTRWYFLEIIF